MASENTDRSSSHILSLLQYNHIASVVRASDEPKKPFQSGPRSGYGFESHSANYTKDYRKTNSHRKKRLTSEQLADLKSKSTCNRCHKKGHWASDTDKCEKYSQQEKSQILQSTHHGVSGTPKSAQGTMQFHMAKMSKHHDLSLTPRPLVDDGAPYSGMGIVELRSMCKDIIPDSEGKLLPMPHGVRTTSFWKYGSGSHASSKRIILVSVML